jgi:hypothetical protein
VYESVAGDGWHDLPAIIRAAHDPGVLRGTLSVQRGSHWLARALGSVLSLPAAGEAVPVELRIESTAGGLLWRRSFDGHALVTRQELRADALVEVMGPFACAFELQCNGAELIYRQTGFGVCVGRSILWLPRWFAPRLRARIVAPDSGAAVVRVELTAPFVGRLLRYEGEVRPVEASP